MGEVIVITIEVIVITIEVIVITIEIPWSSKIIDPRR